METLEAQIAKGRQVLLLVDPEHVPDLKRILAGWKNERSDIERQLAEEEQPAESDGDLDPDAVIEELHYLEEHLASNESLLARATFRRVFKTVTLHWNHDVIDLGLFHHNKQASGSLSSRANRGGPSCIGTADFRNSGNVGNSGNF